MKKYFLVSVCTLLSMLTINAQTTTAESIKNISYKIVFQLTSDDTLVQKALVKQIDNALTAAPKSKIEVVCHNKGISFLQTAKTQQADKIKELKAQGVVFAACENTMRERKIEKSDIVPEAVFVPAGVIEIADKQMRNWSYLKAGF